MRNSLWLLAIAVVPLAGQAPAQIRGDWSDDYGASHQIGDTLWRHGGNRYRLVRWDSAGNYLIARRLGTDSAAVWTRIDLIRLDSMPPWRWGYCLATWTAPSADSAAATRLADRTTPRSGCGGFPFTRMKQQRD